MYWYCGDVGFFGGGEYGICLGFCGLCVVDEYLGVIVCEGGEGLFEYGCGGVSVLFDGFVECGWGYDFYVESVEYVVGNWFGDCDVYFSGCG